MFVLSAVNNSVLNGYSEPIQLQVTDIKTCFDKMWLQTSTNALYECGLRNKNIEMQGTVMSSLKCTSSMDRLNKTVLCDSDLHYYYKGDRNIPIGVRGMLDNTLGISKCGNTAVKLKTTINAFIESQTQTLS